MPTTKIKQKDCYVGCNIPFMFGKLICFTEDCHPSQHVIENIFGQKKALNVRKNDKSRSNA